MIQPATLRFHLQKSWVSKRIALHLLSQPLGSDRQAIATNITFQEIQDNGLICEPLLQLSEAEAQQLADQLYAAGIRPSEAAGSAGQLDAVKYHLEDLRKLVFKSKGAA